MNYLRIAKLIIVFLLFYLGLTFLLNYNSQENIEKRCLIKFERDFKNPLELSREELEQLLDLADNNYFKCIGITQY